MPAYDDGTTPTLVTEKPPAIVFKIRGGADTYMKHDGKVGTAGKGLLTSDELAFTVAATQDQQLFQMAPCFADMTGEVMTQNGDEVVGTLCASDWRHSGNEFMNSGKVFAQQSNTHPAATTYIVRRLTPTECERLQGFPDGWTDIGDWMDSSGKTRKTTDGNRYKALGNSFAVPVVRWLGERIEQVNEGRTDGAAAL